MRACMKSSIAGERQIGRGQQDRKFVLMEVALVSALKTIVKDTPAAAFLQQRKVFERSRRIVPYEQKVRPRAVMHGPNFDLRLSPSLEISPSVRRDEKRGGRAPGR